MFDLLASFRFWINIIIGHLPIYLLLSCYSMAFGAVRNKKLKVDAIFLTFFVIIAIFVFRLFPREMDIPGILSMQYKEIEGTVCDYKKERESTVGHADLTGGTIDVKDSETGKVFRFRDVNVPSNLHTGDSVKMLYLKHYKMGACIEINGKRYQYYTDNNKSVGIIIIALLLVSIPIYYFWVFKVKPIFDYMKDYSVYVYQDLFIRAMKMMYLFMLQTAAVLIIAIFGNYRTSWDWYWGLLLLVDYVGIFCLSFLRQATFVIMDGQYSYYNLKKTFEGELKDIGSVEMVKGGIILHIKEEELYIRCTQMPYADLLKDKLADFK